MNYQKVYNDLISYRKKTPLEKSKDLYTELHHIVPRCLGGSNHKENLVRLTAREHFIAHRLLAKIHRENLGLSLSVLLMMETQGRVMSSHEIQKLKSLSSQGLSEKMASRMAELWKDPKYVEKILSSRSGVWTEERRRSASERTKKQFEDVKQRKIQTDKKLIQWSDENVRGKILEGQRKFLEDHPWPWQRSRALPTKHIWGLAATYWELSKFNPNNKQERYGYVKFTNEFCSGKYGSIFSYMTKMFEDGWVPLECDDWVSTYRNCM